MRQETSRPRNGNGASGAAAPLESTTAHTFEREGCTIHWWQSGPRDGPCLVLAHGVTIDHGTYATQVPLLVRAGQRVVTWDLRGHGRSRPAAQPLTFERSVDDLEALVEESAAAVDARQCCRALQARVRPLHAFRQRTQKVADGAITKAGGCARTSTR
jgi:alpha-beta hydrolase superfamily lysophospholipase